MNTVCSKHVESSKYKQTHRKEFVHHVVHLPRIKHVYFLTPLFSSYTQKITLGLSDANVATA
jgi:hypothetical protein